MKISFDFDGTLGDNEAVQKLAKVLVNAGCDVWVLTSRVGLPVKNKDLYGMMARVGIPEHKVIFTPFQDKYHEVEKHGFELHLDDDFIEVGLINTNLSGNKCLFVGCKDAQRYFAMD